MRLWICLVFVAVAFAGTKAQSNEYLDEFSTLLKEPKTINDEDSNQSSDDANLDFEDYKFDAEHNDKDPKLKSQESKEVIPKAPILSEQPAQENIEGKELSVEESVKDEETNNDYDDIETLDELFHKALQDTDEDQETDKRVIEEIEGFKKSMLQNEEPEDNFDDYQFEDNRLGVEIPSSFGDDDDDTATNEDKISYGNDFIEEVNAEGEDTFDAKNQVNADDTNLNFLDDLNDDDTLSKETNISENDSKIDEEPIKENNDDREELLQNKQTNLNFFDDLNDDDTLSEETNISENDSKNDEELIKENNDDREELLQNEQNEKNNDIISKQAENNEQSAEVEVIPPNSDDVDSDVDDEYEEDTVDKAKADLDEDIKRLFATWDKLSQDSIEAEEYEDLFDRPYKEGNVLAVRDYEDGEESETSEESNDEVVMKESDINDKTKIGNDETEGIAAPDINVEDDDSVEKQNIEPSRQQKAASKDSIVENLDETNDDINSNENNKQDFENETSILSEQKAVNEDENQETNEEVEIENSDVKEASDILMPNAVDVGIKSDPNDNYEAIMYAFVNDHKDALDIESHQDVAPVHITLSYEDPVIITSPNYPGNYPTNNVVDWILEGEGIGVELNITDLNLRGAVGDYLLVIPGGLDESNSEGLVFSYHLSEPRRFRFLEMDRVFVRFYSGPGFMGFTGFNMSVKLISPLPEDDEVPEPEPLLPTPTSIIAVQLAGVNTTSFRAIQEDFRRLIADMATMYINANNIDMGLNTTNEVTQIVSSSFCNIEWPNYEDCVVVRFAVPLGLPGDDEDRLNERDLSRMWYRYINQDPFATRLRLMGVSEFLIPNETRVVTLWGLMAFSILLTVVGIVFVMWRYNCFDNYTRMTAYSDTDSMFKEKADDLYPTPHQTLPPLYGDEKFDDSTSIVDMGGFTNRSYVRDDLFDDSDDEVDKRDRYTDV